MSASAGGPHWTKRADRGQGDTAPLRSHSRGVGAGGPGQKTSAPPAPSGHWEVPSQQGACGPASTRPPRARCPGRAADLQQPARLHGPEEDLEGVLGPGSNDLPTRVHCHAGELSGPRGREGAEVPVPAGKRGPGLAAPPRALLGPRCRASPRASASAARSPTSPAFSPPLAAQQRGDLL